jgi:hypothetical protein
MDSVDATLEPDGTEDPFVLAALGMLSVCRRFDALAEQFAPSAAGRSDDAAVTALLGAVSFRLRLGELFSTARAPKEPHPAGSGRPVSGLLR